MHNDTPTTAEFAAINEKILRDMVTWRDFAEIESWAAANGGEGAVRRLLASRKQLTSHHKDSVAVGAAWIAAREAAREERSTRAAERSARWAGWAILISVVALLLSVLAYLKT